MAKRFTNKKNQRFYFQNENNKRTSYVLIYGEEVSTLSGEAPSGDEWTRIKYRGRIGEMKNPSLSTKRCLEMYFLDVGQGDAAFVVTPNNTKILVDGGLKERALGFLIWKYRLDEHNTKVTIDYLILSHGDSDHVSGLIPILKHPKIHINNILHNGIAVYSSGFCTELGNVTKDNKLTTLHSTLDELKGEKLSAGFAKWTKAVIDENCNYKSVSAADGVINIGDRTVQLEVLGPKREPDGKSLSWLGGKSFTINGHSLVFCLTHGRIRTFFSGDLNTKGSKHLLKDSTIKAKLDAHIFKSPHHGSHDYYQPLFDAIAPMITVVSSGDSPDHGHPRALFLGGVGLSGRGKLPLVFSTEIAATFVESHEKISDEQTQPTIFGEVDYATAAANKTARLIFKKTLPGIINVRSTGEHIYTARRVMASYQWESYGPIEPVEKTKRVE